jgi:CheY-like chemotaxis protein
MSMTILVIDDEAAVRQVTVALLRRAGFTVLAAESGAAGLRELCRDGQRVDLILLDVAMSGMDGIQTLAEIRRIDTLMPVLLISGQPESEIRERMPEDRRADFLGKPFQPEELVRAIRDLSSEGATSES